MLLSSARLGVRLPTALSGRRLALLVGAMLMIGVPYAVARAGGAPSGALAPFGAVAIVLAACATDWRGGLLTGLATGLLFGPLRPLGTSGAGAPPTWGWPLDLAADAGLGVLVGWWWQRAQRRAAQAGELASRVREDVAQAAEEHLRHTIEATADGILVFDGSGHLSLANRAAERLLGAPRSTLLGATYRELNGRVALVPGPAGTPDRDKLVAALEAGRPLPEVELMVGGAGATQRTLQVIGVPIRPEAPRDGLVVTLHDVTIERVLARERAARLEELEAVAAASAGAPSAGAAGDALLASFARIWPVAAAAIYLFDDGVTQRLAAWWAPETGPLPPPLIPPGEAATLRSLVREGPQRTDLARLPGGADGAALLAARGAQSLLVVPLLSDGAVVGALLAGDRQDSVPLSPEGQEHLRALAALAGGIVQRAVGDEEAARGRQRTRVSALLAEPAQLVPHYQPILSLATGRVVGYEALARFMAPPIQPPNVTFAQATAVGLGAELQALAIGRALAVAKRAVLPRGRFLSVNISPRYLSSPPVTAVLPDGPLDWLVIEVTEEEAVADYGALRHALAPYLARGARLAVDDAGAGYASMRHVTELRPAFVKLDAQLVRGLGDDAARQALVSALVHFTGAIGATTIAEGVETADDLALLAKTRATLLVQGYAIARPGGAWPAVSRAATVALRSRWDDLRPRVAGVDEIAARAPWTPVASS